MITEDQMIKACETICCRLDETEQEMLTKEFIGLDGTIFKSVVVITGENAEEFVGLIREWAASKGMRRTN